MFPFYSFHPRSTIPSAHRPWRPKAEELKPNCPRCDSPNTKFCYYNNYCLTQPRYLCKTCRRYWTKGGSLRNVPVGGGRKSRRAKSSKLNSTIPISSPPVSLRPDHTLESMSCRTRENFVFSNHSFYEIEKEEGSFGARNRGEISGGFDFVEGICGEKDLFLSEGDLEVKRREFGGVGMDSEDNCLVGLNDFVSETDLMWETSRFQNDVCLAGLGDFV